MPKDSASHLARWVTLQPNIDLRGRLTEIDFRQLPFVPVRAFFIDQVTKNTVRGRHAHREGSQLLVCLNGKIEVELRIGEDKERVICTPESEGLLISKGIWSQQKYLEDDSILLVFCSHPYDETSYLDRTINV